MKHRKTPFKAGLFLFTCVIAASFAAQPVSALSGVDFSAGRIIDNAVFYNANTMSVGAIQDFLDKKVPSCDTPGSKPHSSGGTRAAYGAARGYSAPYTCLKDYYQNPDNGQDNYGGKAIPAGAKSAAQIIYDASVTYGINPQVILVTLQKESSIITDDWPWTSQYRTVMGYGCPDSGPNNTANCDSQFYGFSNQVINAAKQFRRYATNPRSYNFLAGTNNTIQWNPTVGCGSSSVYIENQATASLYNYTPYQPNAAALNNLYGTGDNCSAYGNRNFWRLFNEWFGSTYASAGSQEEGDAQKRIRPIEFNGQIYIFYYDAFNRVVRMATQNQSTGAWQYSIIDGDKTSGVSGFDASMGGEVTAIAYNSAIHIFHYDKTRGNLRHGWFNGSTWRFENLDGDPGSIARHDGDVGINPSTAIYGSTLQLLYYDKTHANLRHSWFDGTTWRFENLDGDPGSVGRYQGDVGVYSTMTPYLGGLQAFYYDQGANKLRHAWNDASGWHFEDLDGGNNPLSRRSVDVGINPVAVTYGSTLQVFYYDRPNTNLRHAWHDASGWHFWNLDGDPGSAGKHDSKLGLATTAVEYKGNLQVFYYDSGYGNLRNAWFDGATWRFQNLDGDKGSIAGGVGTIGVNPGVTAFGTSLQLYYYDRTRGSFKHAWRDVNWAFEELGPNVIY